MATKAPLLMRIVANAVCVSHRAGKIIRDVMSKGDLGIVEKGKDDLQTEADRSAQRCIVASLHKHFPQVAIFGEEQLDNQCNHANIPPEYIEDSFSDEVLKKPCPDELKNVKDKEVVIWVDPLDGTSEYTQGLLDHVTVLIGIAVKGKAVAGVVCQPYYNYQAGLEHAHGRCIWGIIGLGSFGYDENQAPEGQNIITTTRSHSNKTVVEAVDSCQPTDVIRVGGAGHKVLLLLEGKAHAYVFGSPGCKKWDTAAPEAILHAAGGKLTDIHGKDIEYHSTVKRRNAGGVLAAMNNHQWYLEKIPNSVRENLPS